jgi:RNA polymerase sigma-70 factor (ECF subfamily)
LGTKVAMTLHKSITHEALMARFKISLDKTAFEQLVLDYACPAAAVAHQMLKDRALAEDAVQEAFIRIINKRNQYVASRSFSRWFYAILKHVCIDLLRKRKRDQEFTKRLFNEIKHIPQNELLCDHASLLSILPSHDKSVLELRVVYSMSFKEIAAALNITEEAAKKRAQRGLRKLREKIDQHQYLQRRAI